MYYRRSAWTNKPNRSVSFKGSQTSTTFHYPGFGNSAIQTRNWSLQKCFNQIRTWEGQHQARGSKNIEYNFFVLPTGDVVEGRGFKQSGANGSRAANLYSISVQILIGDNEPLNNKFLKGIAEILKLIKQNQPKALNKFYGHQHWVGTRCPGPYVMAALRSGTINKNMASGSISVPSGGTSAPAPKPSTNVWETSPRIKGMTKTEIKDIQNKLIKAGHSVGSYGADGSYKADTVSAVKAFQKKNGLTVDGVAGPSTLSKLNTAIKGSSAPAKKPAAKPAPKKKNTLKVDGRFGTSTVKDFQRFLNSRGAKLKVDGKAGHKFWTALAEYLNAPYKDGKVSRQSYKASELGNGITQGWEYTGRGSSGSQLVKLLQKWVGVKQDGIWHEATTSAVQRKLNTHGVGM